MKLLVILIKEKKYMDLILRIFEKKLTHFSGYFITIQKLWNLDVESLSLECCGQLILPECKQRWVSAAAVGQGSLVCGDRGGTVHVYPLNGESVSQYA